MSLAERTTYRRTIVALTVFGVVLGIAVAALTADVIIGVIAGATFIALTVQSVKLWAGGNPRRPNHP